MSLASSIRLTTACALALSLAALASPGLTNEVPSQRQIQGQQVLAPQLPASVFRALSVEAPPPGAARIVMPCDTDAVARRSFERRVGQPPVFVTAEQALEARDRREVWTTPRCMTDGELARLSERLR